MTLEQHRITDFVDECVDSEINIKRFMKLLTPRERLLVGLIAAGNNFERVAEHLEKKPSSIQQRMDYIRHKARIVWGDEEINSRKRNIGGQTPGI